MTMRRGCCASTGTRNDGSRPSPLARCLIIGCGCRGRLVAQELQGRGHTVRGTSRTVQGVAAIEACGIEAVRADPDVVATLVPALEHVTVVCILLGSATASPEAIQALHGTRLEMLLTKLVDTTVRGVVYEARGAVPGWVLDAGAERVRSYAERSLAGYALLEVDPGAIAAWAEGAVEAVCRLLAR